MTKREAWTQVAAAFIRALDGRRPPAATSGLCWAVDLTVGAWAARTEQDEALANAMYADLDDARGKRWALDYPRGWWWPAFGSYSGHSPTGDIERAMLALLLAESAED